MLTIRQEQIKVLQQIALKNFEEHLFRRFRAAHRQQSGAWVREQISEGVMLAIGLGIVVGADVVRFVDLKLRFDKRLDNVVNDPAVRQTLASYDGAAKMDFLEEQLLDPDADGGDVSLRSL